MTPTFLLDVATPSPALAVVPSGGAGAAATGQVPLGNNATMTTANTYYQQDSISLTAGTWAIFGVCGNAGGNATITPALSLTTANGTNAMPVQIASAGTVARCIAGVIKLATTTTIFLNQACTTAAQVGQGYMTAVRIA